MPARGSGRGPTIGGIARPRPAAPAPNDMDRAPRPLRVWDLPTRLFHWTLVLLLAGSFVTVKVGGSLMVWHERLGFAALALVLFRLIWGVAGGRYARFAQFVRGPRSVLAYLRGAAPGQPGHNPVGALSVLALLAAVAFQAVSGLFTNDDIAFEGPLARYVSGAWSSALTTWHRWNEWVILGLVALHVAAIVYYRVVRGRDLIGPMVTGDAPAAAGAVPSRDDAGLRLRALVIFAGCAALVGWLVSR